MGASGGAAADAGYEVSAGGANNAVVGFSLTGATIDGSGVLTTLDILGDPSAVCLENIVIADANGSPLSPEVVDCLTISIGPGSPAYASVQVIHNSASPTVDVYVDGGLAIQNFEYRMATSVLQLPTSVTVGIAPAGGDIIAEFPFQLMEGGEYVVVATGLLGDEDTPFDLAAAATTFGASDGNVGLDIYHGSTDAPAVDVYANDGLLLSGLGYGSFSGYTEVPAADYVVGIAPSGGDVIAEFDAPLSGLGGGSAVVFASGFLSGGGEGGEWDGDACSLPDHSIHAVSYTHLRAHET